MMWQMNSIIADQNHKYGEDRALMDEIVRSSIIQKYVQ